MTAPIEPSSAYAFTPTPRPSVGSVESAGRAGTEDTRRCDAARDEPCAEPCVDPFTAVPGAVPFADYLQALNTIAGLRGAPVHGEPAEPSMQSERSSEDETWLPRRDDTLPRLADVAPVEPGTADPAPVDRMPLIRDVYLRPATTGRMIDAVI